MSRNFTLIPKLLLSQAFILCCGLAAHAQGWVGNGSGSLYPVNNSLGLSPLSVGIGTATPTDQFHTTGTVRFQGLTQNDTTFRVVTQDTSGRLYWRNIASIGTGGGGWALTGNSGTNPAANFLGTTDQQRLVFRTANTEKMTVLANGNVGIGTASPIKPFQVDNKGIEDNNAYLSGASPSLYFSQTTGYPSAPYNTPVARIGLATRSGAHLVTARAGDFVVYAVSPNASVLFGTGLDPTNNGIERARISPAGNLGVNTIAPTAKLHINGDVRFENLPAGSGNTLVIDANGNVYRGSGSQNPGNPGDSTAIAALQQEVSDLKQALADMQEQINALKSGSIDVTPSGTNRRHTLTIAPNPVSTSTNIRYAYPSTVQKAYLNINDLNGKLVKRVDLTGNTSSSVTVSADAFTGPGTYIYSLELDGKVAESKKLVVAK